MKKGDEPATFGRILPHGMPWKNITIIVHNAKFDALVLALHNKLHPPFIIDTLDLARHIEPRWSNSLADLCKRHGLVDKGEAKQFEGYHFNGDTDMWQKLSEYATNDAERTYDLLGILLPKLSNPAFELELAAWTRNLFIKPVLSFDVDRARVLKGQMQDEVTKASDRVGRTEKQIRSEAQFTEDLRLAMDPEEPPFKQGKKKRLLAIAKTDPGYSYLLHHPREEVRHLMEARVGAKSWPIHIKRIEKLRQMYRAAGNRLPIPLKFSGAHTGRWSGDGGINPQNLTARGDELAVQTRTLIEAPEGYVLYITDQSQIEARTLDWLSEQNDMLRAFAEGRQIYCDFASKFCGHRIRKPKKTDSEIVAGWHNNYRQMGKIGILGCGYGMGKDRCREYAKNTYKVDLSIGEADAIVKLYRRTHPMVVLFWEKLERAFRMATQTGQAYELTYGLRFFRDGNATVIQLPSGRRLYYTGAKVEGTTRHPQLTMKNPRAHGEKKIHMWGGYLAENVVQAVSRDLLAVSILRIENELGLRIP
ncbi:hypothetical protein KAR91_12690, partial [Candidatus Pacearchaeota archaeon]|nr:hypothetical protein [Candidatus Pacearchaeota archaeon]